MAKRPKRIPKPPISLAASRPAPRPTQREVDQESTIETLRLLLAYLVRKHGTLDVLHIPVKALAELKTGQMKVLDTVVPGHVTLSIRDANAIQPNMKPRLVVR